MASAEHQRNYRLQRIAAGICPRCGKSCDQKNRTLCFSCSENQKEEYRNRRTLIGHRYCVDCGELSETPQSLRCAVHRKERLRQNMLSTQRALYADRRSRGVCTRCGAADPVGMRCDSCAIKSHGYYIRRRDDKRNEGMNED